MQLLQAIDGVEIVVVCNRSAESSQRVADEFGIPRIAAKWSVPRRSLCRNLKFTGLTQNLGQL
jgi:hypothetical protein